MIGGGPAGMEAARVAAQRGHSVTLFEKNGTLGGLLPVARGYKGDHERLSDLNDYLAHQLDVHGVNVVLGTEATAETVAAESPEVVIVAVGGQREGRLEGSANVPVVAFDDLPAAELGERVVICGAGAQAVDCALYLLAQGKKIQMVHDAPASEVGKEQSMWVRTYVIPQLTSQGVKIWNSATVEGVSDEGMAIVMNGGVPKVLPCDSVVECYDMLPNTALADELTAAGYDVRCVGDCAEPWNIGLAIRSGNLTARAI